MILRGKFMKPSYFALQKYGAMQTLPHKITETYCFRDQKKKKNIKVLISFVSGIIFLITLISKISNTIVSILGDKIIWKDGIFK